MSLPNPVPRNSFHGARAQASKHPPTDERVFGKWLHPHRDIMTKINVHITSRHTDIVSHAISQGRNLFSVCRDAVVSCYNARKIEDSARHPLPNFDNKEIGRWNLEHPDTLHRQVIRNLKTLQTLSKKEPAAKALHAELNQIWDCLFAHEKARVLNEIGNLIAQGKLGMPDAPNKGSAVHWLRLMWKTTPEKEKRRVLKLVQDKHAKAIAGVVYNKPNNTMLDTGFDYKTFLKANNYLGTIPAHCRGKRVAIIGAGLAGMTAAFELMKIGLQPVIIEASDRIGGRIYARHYQNDGAEAPEFSEMGAMRFPPIGAAFFHYLNMFDVKTDPNFPNPGKVPTTLYFKGQKIDWPAGQDAPDHPVLQEVARDFKALVAELSKPLEEARAANNPKRIRELWQGYIKKFKMEDTKKYSGDGSGKRMRDMNFLEGVKYGLKDILGKEWTDEQLDAFGALGIGTGGFSPLYESNFLEILRIILNKMETDQHLIPGGTSSVIDKFRTTKIERPDGSKVSLEKNAKMRLNTKVTGISIVDDKPRLEMSGPNHESHVEQFDAVIVATTPRAMMNMGLSPRDSIEPLPDNERHPLDHTVAAALTGLHMVSSSKMFIRTKTKFWKDNPEIPQTIQTDALPHAVYCLDYPDTEHGVVLVSYTWEKKSDDLAKNFPNPRERLDELKKWIKETNPEFAAALEPITEDDIHCIDWQKEENYFGAFKLNKPGQEPNVQSVYYDFLKAGSQMDSHVYLAGDGISYAGGWAHGASSTGINATIAVIKGIGGTPAKGSPLTEMRANLYDYS
jgi:tryptophan 2-monooxygenase